MTRQTSYARFVHLSSHPRTLWALALIAFFESFIFPIPPDFLLIPMMLAAPKRAWLYAGVCLIFSVLGGLFGYMLGALFHDMVGQKILAFYGKEAHFAQFQNWYHHWGGWAVFIGGITPVPYKVITIFSGATSLSLATFITASLISRGIRFFLLAALIQYFGLKIQTFLERRLGLVSSLVLIILIAGFFALRSFGAT